MQRITRITDPRGSRDYTIDNYPLTIGTAEAEIQIPDCHESIAVIHLEQGYPKLFKHKPKLELWHNHQLVEDAVWLKSGDLLEYHHYRIDWQVVGDRAEALVSRNPVQTIVVEPSPKTITHTQHGGNTPPLQADDVTTRNLLKIWLYAGLAILIAFCGFILMARPISVTINPVVDSQNINGDWPIFDLGTAQLALPGDYRIQAEKQGFFPLNKTFTVVSGADNQWQFELHKLPGLLSIDTQPEHVQISIDGKLIGTSPLTALPVSAGSHHIRLRALRYQELEQEFEVMGMQQQQHLSFSLKADWATVSLSTQPSGAEIRIDDQKLTQTPAELELISGQHTIDLSKKGYQKHRLTLQVQAMEDQKVPVIKLVKITQSKPKPKAKPKPKTGIVFITIQPADAELWVDGIKQNNATARLTLASGQHQLKAEKKGYQGFKTTVNADSKNPATVNIVLKPGTSSNQDQTYINTAGGQRLIKIKATPVFSIGASRREPGRRSNENLRKIQLTRPFYIAKTEVSNAQFRKFRANHNSGRFNRFDLNEDSLPAVNVSWQDAAAYANWLSEQDGLPLAYLQIDGKWQLIRPVTTGYRLPTEAEWEYTARFARRDKPVRFSWPSDRFPPTVLGGNYSDSSAADYLPQFIQNYNDGYVVSAPVKSFKANPTGIYNLGGNVSEWVQDYYTIYPGMEQKLQKNPLGPTQGRHRVIKGASWKDATISELRFSYRDYSDKARDDVGFRIARYAQ